MNQESMQPNVQGPHYQALHQFPAILKLHSQATTLKKALSIMQLCEHLENQTCSARTSKSKPSCWRASAYWSLMPRLERLFNSERPKLHLNVNIVLIYKFEALEHIFKMCADYINIISTEDILESDILLKSQNKSINYNLNSQMPKIGWLFNSERLDFISSIDKSIYINYLKFKLVNIFQHMCLTTFFTWNILERDILLMSQNNWLITS